MKGRAIVEALMNKFLETLDHLRSEIWIKLNHQLTVIFSFDDRYMAVSKRFYSCFDDDRFCFGVSIGLLCAAR